MSCPLHVLKTRFFFEMLFWYWLRYRPNVLEIWVSVSVSNLNQIPSGFCRALNRPVNLHPLGGIQQLRGQEGGEGGQQKVHACPPGGRGGL